MSNKRRLKDYLILTAIFVYSIVYFLFIVKKIPNYAMTINGLFICVISFVSYLCYGFQKYSINKLRKNVIIETIVAIFLYFTIIYTLGIFTGFLKNAYSLNILSIIKHITIPLITVIALEMFRYIFISSNRDSFKMITLGTIAIMLFDIVLCYNEVGNSLLEMFIYLTVVIIPIIFKNAVLSYVNYQTGYESCLIYTIPLCLYKYFVPVFPDLGNYLTCIVNITLPSMIFIYTARIITEYLAESENNLKVVKRVLIDIPLIFIFTIFVGLISGYFTYHLIGVNTSAIKPQVNRGDAVMIHKDVRFEEINAGDIIAYRSGKDIVIDKIIDRQDTEDGVKIYIRDIVNEEKEDENKELTKEEFIGIYKFRIPKIAFPTIWFKDFIGGDA